MGLEQLLPAFETDKSFHGRSGSTVPTLVARAGSEHGSAEQLVSQANAQPRTEFELQNPVRSRVGFLLILFSELPLKTGPS